MICGPLDIPDEIAAALDAGQLAIFAGAGVSCGEPSKLPSFGGLTEKIGMRLAQAIPKGRLDFDVLLGDWKRQGGHVHSIAKEIIGSSPKHNPIHEHLLQLFPKQEQVRIITTNFDRHFSKAADALDLNLPVYRAPALPLGHDFHGLVYLHGYVDDRPDRLALTDADFGRAYLSEGWARTFLQGLYSKFHVLFVGYSHDDVLLTYLAKGLSQLGPAKRHAFQLRGREGKWNRIHVTPIPYGLPPSSPDIPEDHSELEHGIKRWLELRQQKPSDEMVRVRLIIEHTESPAVTVGGESTPEPSNEAGVVLGFRLSPDDADFLRRTLSDPNKTVWFMETAKDLRWVAWAHETKLLISFADTQIHSLHPLSAQVKLLWWALNRLMADHSPEALELFAKLGGRLGPDVWQHCIRELSLSQDDDPVWNSPHLDHWLVALRHGFIHSLRHDADLLGRLIVRLARRNLFDHAIALFGRLLQVQVEWRPPMRYLDSKVRWSARGALVSDLHNLKDAWIALAPLRGRPEHRIRLFRIFGECVDELYAAFGPPDHQWDPLAGFRIVVDEPRNEYDTTSAEAFVADMLCQLIKEQSNTPEGIGESQILIWLRSERLLWQRLGYLALREDRLLDPSRKATIILELGLIYPPWSQLQHDPHSLLIAIYGTWSLETKRAIFDVAAVAPDLGRHTHLTAEEQSESAVRIRNGLLNRLALSFPGDPSLSELFGRLGLSLPEARTEPEAPWRDGEMRDLNQSPVPTSEILKRPPAEQLNDILGFQSESDWDPHTREGYFSATVAAAKENIVWAKELIAVLAKRSDGAELWTRLGWDCPWLSTDADFRRWFILELFPSVNPALWTFQSYRAWSGRLLGLVDFSLDLPLGADEGVALTAWSAALWSACGPKPDEVLDKKDPADAHMRAINHPLGKIVDFWLSSVAQHRRNDPTAPYDWPDELKPLIDNLLARDDDYCLMALSILGQKLRFVRYAFPDWTRQEIYPRFNFAKDANQALCLWSTWLAYGNLSLELAQELPTLFASNHTPLLEAENETTRRFLSYLAAIATSIAAPRDTLTWLLTILRDAKPEQRSWWTSEVARNVRGANEADQRRVWMSWAMDYLLRFRHGTFGDPSRRDARHEFFEFLHWPVAFAAIGGEVLDSLEHAHPHHIERLEVIYEIKQVGLAANAPDLTARYLRWTLVDVGADRWGFYGLDDVLTELSVTAVNRLDLGQVSERLLMMNMIPEHKLLASKLAAFDAAR